MGDGLKRVAKACGGLTVTDGKSTVHYDGEGKRVEAVYVARRDASFSRTGGGFASRYHRIVGDFMSACSPDVMLLDEATKQRVENVSRASLCKRCFRQQ